MVGRWLMVESEWTTCFGKAPSLAKLAQTLRPHLAINLQLSTLNSPPPMILLIDNYDSFAHNLARYFKQLGQETLVVRNDAIDVAGVRDLAPQAIIISPGPCTPAEAGCSKAIVSEFFDKLPILGICLGHQAIAEALGGRIIRATEPMHGRTSQVDHTQTRLFAEIPTPFSVCRYHSHAAS